MNSKIDRDDFGQLAALQRRADNMRTMREQKERIAQLDAEVADWMKCARDNQEMLNTIGRQLGGQIPEQLVSEVAAERMAEIAALRAENAHLKRALALSDALRNKERNLPL